MVVRIVEKLLDGRLTFTPGEDEGGRFGGDPGGIRDRLYHAHPGQRQGGVTADLLGAISGQAGVPSRRGIPFTR